MLVRTLEYQRAQEQKYHRRLALSLQGVQLAIRASGIVPFKEESGFSEVQDAFQSFVESLTEMKEPEAAPKLSMKALRWKYGSRWEDHLDELQEEDREEIEGH
jgi:hypothetical protein